MRITSSGARALLPVLLLHGFSCSSTSGSQRHDGAAGFAGSAASSGGAGGGGSDASGGLGAGASGAGSPGVVLGGSSGAGGASCASETSQAKLEPVYLAFVFDVSGSMGQGDFEWHDRALKWEPVVAAVKAFFADEAAAGISASLVFFPAESQICQTATYAEPEVPMTPLPSPAFAAAIDAVTPVTEDDWRGGTPTLPVLEGTIAYLDALAVVEPAATYSIVLVTDGYPQTCEAEGNSLEGVQAVVATVADRIPTYVVGVRNPPVDDAPDTVTNLNQIAVSGGTEEAFLVETGSPEQTAAALTAIIDGIRQASVSCDVEIPPPPADQVFDPGRVNVSYADGAGAITSLGYDASCASEQAWRYDDPANPGTIVLCDSTCAVVQADPGARLDVEFGCSSRPPK